jgi:hypothetical protein
VRRSLGHNELAQLKANDTAEATLGAMVPPHTECFRTHTRQQNMIMCATVGTTDHPDHSQLDGSESAYKTVLASNKMAHI